MYNLQWNGAGLSVLPSEDDIYTQHVKLKLSCKTQIVHKCNFSSQDYTSLPPFPIMHTTYSLHTQLHTDGGLKLQKYDIWCEQFSCTLTGQTCALLCLSWFKRIT